MLTKILATIGTRYLVALLNLALIFINAKILGIEGVGLIGVIVASVNIVVVFCAVLSVNTLVYFMSKYPVTILFPIAYLWAIIGSFLACGILYLTGLVPEGYLQDIYFLALLNTLVAANSRFLLGRDEIKLFNITHVLQGGLLFFILLFLYFVIKQSDIQAYIAGLYLTNGIAFLFSLYMVLPYLLDRKRSEKNFFQVLWEMVVYGAWVAVDNIAGILSTRLNYFIIERFGGLGSVGLLDGGTKVSEGIWHISNSVGLITYREVVRNKELSEQKKTTLRLFKLTVCILTIAMLCILCIPEWIYTDILFTREFTGIRNIIQALSIGVIAWGGNTVFSHFFTGSGRIRHGAFSSLIGLIVLGVSGYILIPVYGVTGAAICTSISFSSMLLYSFIAFKKITEASLEECIPNRGDLAYLRTRIRGKKG